MGVATGKENEITITVMSPQAHLHFDRKCFLSLTRKVQTKHCIPQEKLITFTATHE